MSGILPPLRGITWGHTRGLVPLQATAQRFAELNPGFEIVWEKRSLRQFEEFPIEKLAETYDLLVVDHPFIGTAAEHRVFLPLDDWLPRDFIANQAQNSVGGSHASYIWSERLWALAIDAATPVVAWRPDLLNARGVEVPATWSEMLGLARLGAVESPAAPINCLMNFYGLCVAAGEAPFAREDRVIAAEPGGWALERLRELIAACPAGCLEQNPIQSLERLASGANTRVAYTLFPYGYSNYSREGYAGSRLVFGDLPRLETGQPLTTTLGGTGLAISASCTRPQLAADYAAFVASEQIQRTLYTRCGGQPGHRAAWLDPENNQTSLNYFRATLPALDRAFVRPRYAGYLHGFQAPAGLIVHRCVRRQLTPQAALRELDAVYLRSRTDS